MRPRCPEHGLALDDAGDCLRCKKSGAVDAKWGSREVSSRRPRVPMYLLGVPLAALIFGFGVRVGWVGSAPAPEPAGAVPPTPEPADAVPPAPDSLEGSLRTTNASGRSGTYFIPRSATRRVPVLLAFHGSASSGASLLAAFRPLARTRGFVVVAPDSGFVPEAGTFTWRVASEPNETTPDAAHVSAALDEALEIARAKAPEIEIAPDGWLAVGFSGGASSAPYRASHDPRFSHFAVLHGGVFPGGLGPLLPRGWFSTGEDDSLRPPRLVGDHARAAAGVFGESLVEFHLYPGAHAVSPREASDVVRFWLGD